MRTVDQQPVLKRCAACRKESPVSAMKTCMHNQMHRYVCDRKCMQDFYNPPRAEVVPPVSVPSQLLGSAQTNAARDVLAERERQITKEGWTPEHDDEHDGGELSAAAAAYALHAADHLHPQSQGDGGDDAPDCWPWHDSVPGRGEGPERTVPAWWKPGAPRRNLVKAAALILAEIERLDRAAHRAHQGEQS